MQAAMVPLLQVSLGNYKQVRKMFVWDILSGTQTSDSMLERALSGKADKMTRTIPTLP